MDIENWVFCFAEYVFLVCMIVLDWSRVVLTLLFMGSKVKLVFTTEDYLAQ